VQNIHQEMLCFALSLLSFVGPTTQAQTQSMVELFRCTNPARNDLSDSTVVCKDKASS
jgi:hypothetical protein